MRVVSLLPSTTEILFGIGAGDDVVGVTFECDYPAAARTRRIVSTSAMPEGLAPGEIDAFVATALANGEDLYRLEAGALADLDADLVVTQDLCAVCAVDVSVVDDALAHLGCRADVLTVDPHTIEQVLASVHVLGVRTGHTAAATTWVEALRARLAAVEKAVAGADRPRVLVLEWTDPPFAPGHWIPEMVEIAGGEAVLGKAGERSGRITWDDALGSRPDVVVCAPCGYDLDGAADLAEQVADRFGRVPVWAVDANACFARPGPRIVDGVETLAAILHPDLAGPVAEDGARLVRPAPRAPYDPMPHGPDEVGVGPWPGPWPEGPGSEVYDAALLREGDRRNVVDRYRYWSMEAIVADLDRRRHGFHVAIENWQHDFNIGTIVRSANAFLAAEVHIVGHRRWNRRGAMVTDRYQHVRHHASVADLRAYLAELDGVPLLGIDNLPGSAHLETMEIPERVCFLFGQEGPGLSEAARAECDGTFSIAQFGSTRSINASAAAAIAMHAWVRQHADLGGDRAWRG